MALKDGIEWLNAAVGRHFPVYDIRVDYDTVSFYINVLEGLDEQFEALRLELKERGYIPVIIEAGGEYIISIRRMPPLKTKSVIVNVIMLAITICTTILAGAVGWYSYMGTDSLFSPETVLNGALYFSTPLLLILGTHEMGHYFMAKRHNVAASLPFFMPSFPPLGTFGAFISIREPIPNRKALFDIGIAGPIAGLLVALPVVLLGLHLTATVNQTIPPDMGPGGATYVYFPILYKLLALFVPLPENVLLHPTAFAGWVGLLVTAINLFPAGQLDGGHVARALLGPNARYLSYAAVGALFLLGLNYAGWLLFSLLILFLGVSHPPPLNDTGKLDTKRKVIGVFAAVMLITCFTPVPMAMIPVDTSFTLDPHNSINMTAAPGSTVFMNFTLNNTGNTAIEMQMEVSNVPRGWSAWLVEVNDSWADLPENGTSVGIATDSLNLSIPYEESAQVMLAVQVPESAQPGPVVLSLRASSTPDNYEERSLQIVVQE